MATDAQIAANRENAQASTGPRSESGKLRSSRNAQGLGLFSTQDTVQPHEESGYAALSQRLLQELKPVGAMEEMFAMEILRGAWRLRRCAVVESMLSSLTDAPREIASDPAGAQIAVERARSQATNAVRRATSELRRLQTERLLQSAVLPAHRRHPGLGLASLKDLLPLLDKEEKKNLLERHTAAPEPEITNRTQSAAPVLSSVPQHARNALCPCGRGLKYKRCCGRAASPAPPLCGISSVPRRTPAPPAHSPAAYPAPATAASATAPASPA
jgi:hypothetical protein